MSGMSEPDELVQMEREEQEARLRLEDAREQNKRDDGVYEPEHHALIHRLEAEWKEALERLHLARGHSED
jgi:regulator of RNase E activity RraB